MKVEKAPKTHFLSRDAAKGSQAFNHLMVFSPEAGMGEDRTSSQIPHYLCFGEQRHLIGRTQISSHSIVVCNGRTGGRKGGGILSPDSQLSLSVRWRKAH